MLALSFSFLLASGLILRAKALTINSAVLNSQQIISRVTVSNNHSTNLADVMADFNIDGNGISYIKGKLGIGTRNPQAALHVSGSIRADEICNQAGTDCIAIADIGTGSGGGTGYVNTSSNQTVAGTKTFSNTIQIGNSTFKIYKDIDNNLVLED